LQFKQSFAVNQADRLCFCSAKTGAGIDDMLDMLLGKKRASDRRSWLESYGNLADLTV